MQYIKLNYQEINFYKILKQNKILHFLRYYYKCLNPSNIIMVDQQAKDQKYLNIKTLYLYEDEEGNLMQNANGIYLSN